MLGDIYSLQFQNNHYPISSPPYLSNIDNTNTKTKINNYSNSSGSAFKGINTTKKFGPKEYQFHPSPYQSNPNILDNSSKKNTKAKITKNSKTNMLK